MEKFSLAVRGGHLGFGEKSTDIGVRDGAIVAPGRNLPSDLIDMDAHNLRVLSGGIEAHCPVVLSQAYRRQA